MIEIKGKYNEAIVYTNTLEEVAFDQIKDLCNQEYTKGSFIRIMPDVHAGAGCTIGTTMTIQDKIVPNLVGVDIGCGMETVQIKNKFIELEKLDKLIYEKIPSGFNIRATPHPYSDEIDLTKLKCIKHVNIDRATKSMGTLGGGNHFIEVNKDDEGHIYIVIHSGSRHIGNEVAKYYQQKGYDKLNRHDELSVAKMIAAYKDTGREQEIETRIQELKQTTLSNIPYNLAYVEGELYEDYLHDMKLIQTYAKLNRKAMMEVIIKGMKLKVVDTFTTVHNYIDTTDMLLRKGAVSAKENEKLLIPINMRDGSLICMGKGNKEWNYSAPHGAGRLMSRTKAKESFTVHAFKKEMIGIYTSSVNKNTLDECPMAYKDMNDIISLIGPTAEVVKVIKPIYNFKSNK